LNLRYWSLLLNALVLTRTPGRILSVLLLAAVRTLPATATAALSVTALQSLAGLTLRPRDPLARLTLSKGARPSCAGTGRRSGAAGRAGSFAAIAGAATSAAAAGGGTGNHQLIVAAKRARTR
jgi:hypothetical protein